MSSKTYVLSFGTYVGGFGTYVLGSGTYVGGFFPYVGAFFPNVPGFFPMGQKPFPYVPGFFPMGQKPFPCVRKVRTLVPVLGTKGSISPAVATPVTSVVAATIATARVMMTVTGVFHYNQ